MDEVKRRESDGRGSESDGRKRERGSGKGRGRDRGRGRGRERGRGSGTERGRGRERHDVKLHCNLSRRFYMKLLALPVIRTNRIPSQITVSLY